MQVASFCEPNNAFLVSEGLFSTAVVRSLGRRSTNGEHQHQCENTRGHLFVLNSNALNHSVAIVIVVIVVMVVMFIRVTVLMNELTCIQR